jgi:phosphonatase-like hydrolase
MIRLAVFDLAGTTVEDRDEVARCLVDALAAVGVTVTLRQANHWMGIPKPEAIRRLATNLPDETIDRVHQDFRRRAITHYRFGPDVAEMEGTSDVFRSLRARGIKVGIETGFDRETCDAVLVRMGWGDLVDASAASDEVARGRPAGDLVRKLMAEVGVEDPKAVVKVGDTPADLGEGTNAGCGMVVGVLTGAYDRAGLVVHPHTHLVDSVREIPRLVGA